MPNPNTISYLRYQDIQIPDVTLRQQFQNYMQTGQYAQGLQLLSNNEQQLQGKAYIANTINTIITGILNLENRFNNEVTLFLSQLAQQYFALINQFRKRSTWISTAQYYVYNFVVYNNEIYMCIQQPPVGTIPTNETYWLYLGLRGAKGSPGTNVNMRYTWNPSDTYNQNDLVVYDKNIYVALKQNTNVAPGTDETAWLLFIAVIPGQIFIGTTPPNNPVENTVWFQTETDPLLASSAVIGQFNRYNIDISDWEIMYPNTVFTWIENTAQYSPYITLMNITINTSDWNNQQFIINSSKIKDNSIINILPVSTINEEQYELYNTLSIEIQNANIILTTTETNPAVELPIRVIIQ